MEVNLFNEMLFYFYIHQIASLTFYQKLQWLQNILVQVTGRLMQFIIKFYVILATRFKIIAHYISALNFNNFTQEKTQH